MIGWRSNPNKNRWWRFWKGLPAIEKIAHQHSRHNIKSYYLIMSRYCLPSTPFNGFRKPNCRLWLDHQQCELKNDIFGKGIEYCLAFYAFKFSVIRSIVCSWLFLSARHRVVRDVSSRSPCSWSPVSISFYTKVQHGYTERCLPRSRGHCLDAISYQRR